MRNSNPPSHRHPCPPPTTPRRHLRSSPIVGLWPTVAWLWLAWLTLVVGCPSRSRQQVVAPTRADSSDSPWLVDISEEVGLDVRHMGGADGTYFMPELMAPGAALLDFDNDDDLDLLILNGSTQHQHPPVKQTNRLLRNDNGRLVDITATSGLINDDFPMGVAVGDVNNDGYVDVFISYYGPDRLYLNRRDGTFTDVTQSAGIDNPRYGASASFLDYDRDGRLDLFIANYVDLDVSKKCLDPRGVEDYCGPQVFPGTADKLYRNETEPSPDGTPPDESSIRFRDVSAESKIASERGPGLGVLCADFNRDSWTDIFVANDGAANFLWINQRDGTFKNEAISLGCATSEGGRPQANMGIAIGDIDGDGDDDLFVTHLTAENNALYLAEPYGFRDGVVAAGLAQPSFPYTGFGTAFVDLDHDGDLDILLVNGRVQRPNEASSGGQPASFWAPYGEPNQIFVNDGRGKFAERTAEPFREPRELSRALAIGDWDNDGDMDALISNSAGPYRLYRNDAPKAGHWLRVRAVEPRWGGRDAYDAEVTVIAAGGKKRWKRLVNPGSSYLSSTDPRVHFGLGDVEKIEAIEVRWPDGQLERFPGDGVDRPMVIEHGKGTPGVVP